ncbi:MAG: hypothetical protein M3R53_03815 [Candidatus Eremiobacteraeota bacterium]|nr:hypothetical protein [Candidatus Eremiobacteraeota bacterium]
MIRGILLGTAAFGAVFLLERQLGTVFDDVRRYDKMRAMSGDSPLAIEGLKAVREYVLHRADRGVHGAKTGPQAAQSKPAPRPPANDGGGGSIFGTVLNDVMRYAAIRSM